MLLLVTALLQEAKPLIKALDLKPAKEDHPFKVFENQDIKCIISGIGQLNSASATTYLATITKETIKGFLNIGLASHKSLEPGELILAKKLLSTKDSFYPSFAFDIDCITKDLITVDEVQTKYSNDFCYDMEGFGFYTAAVKFSAFELIHCLKVISDNENSSSQNIDKDMGFSLIEKNIDKIKDQIEKMTILIQKLKKMSVAQQELTTNLRFTVTQKHALHKLIGDLKSLNPDVCLDKKEFEECKSAKEALQLLSKKKKATPFSLIKKFSCSE